LITASVLISFRRREAESAETGLEMLLMLRPAWTRPRVRIGCARVNASRHAPSANMKRHARRPADWHGFNGLCCPTIALGTRQAWRSSKSSRRAWWQSSCSRIVLPWLLVEASGSSSLPRADDVSADLMT